MISHAISFSKIFIIIIVVHNMATIIGIESTAHTFGVGVVKDGKILSNVKTLTLLKAGE